MSRSTHWVSHCHEMVLVHANSLSGLAMHITISHVSVIFVLNIDIICGSITVTIVIILIIDAS